MTNAWIIFQEIGIFKLTKRRFSDKEEINRKEKFLLPVITPPAPRGECEYGQLTYCCIKEIDENMYDILRPEININTSENILTKYCLCSSLAL